MLTRRVSSRAASVLVPSNSLSKVSSPVMFIAAKRFQGVAYTFGPAGNPIRKPQLTAEQRDKVVIDQSQWPAEFKDFDPNDPYKNCEDYIEGMSAWSTFAFGLELGFVFACWELVFYNYYKMA